MKKNKKALVCLMAVMFVICSVIKDIEFLYIKTDSTFIGENVICKIVCIIATVITTHMLGYKLSDIGFKNVSLLRYAVSGLGLGIVTFTFSYGVEILILTIRGGNPRLAVYITNFGLTGATNEMSLSITAVIICMLGNIINVLAEEGLFRGLILKVLSDNWGFRIGNYTQAFLFGVWHIISCAVGVRDGSMTISMAIVYAIGYVILAGILAIEWGICMNMTGVLWVGLFEHFFNNFTSNVLHVLSIGDGGIIEADSLQILRIVLSNILSLIIVLYIYMRKKRKKRIKRIKVM